MPIRIAIVAIGLTSLFGCGETPVLPAASAVTEPPATDFSTPDVILDSTPNSLPSVTLTPRTTFVTSSSGTSTTDQRSRPPWTDVTGNLIGVESECGDVSIVASSPFTTTEIAVIALHGVYSMAGGNGAWVPLGGGVGSAKVTNRGLTVVFDPTNSSTFWEAGAYNGAGVYRTDDAGQTFRQLGAMTHIEGLSVDFTDPLRRTLIASGHESSTLYKSMDGGVTWTDISQSLPAKVGFLVGPTILGPDTYLVGSNNDTASGVYITANGGVSWSREYQGSVIGYSVLPVAGGTRFWALQNSGIIASSDNAATWKLIADGRVTSAVPAEPASLGDGRLATLGVNDQVLASSDGGHTWSFLGSPLPFSPNGISYSIPEKALYAWRFACNAGGSNVISAQSILRLDLSNS
jgi:hypothetical protein